MRADDGGGLTAQEQAVLAAIEEHLLVEDPALSDLLTYRPFPPPRNVAPADAGHPAGAPYWFWWRRRAAD